MSDDLDPTVIPEEIDPLLGEDPWLRFDLWAGRVWTSVETALSLAINDGGPMNSGAQAAFCAAQFAQEVAQMVNPLSPAASDARRSMSAPSGEQMQALLDMIMDERDE